MDVINVGKFKYVNLPEKLVEEIKNYVLTSNRYTTVADFVQEAVRLRLEQLARKEVRDKHE